MSLGRKRQHPTVSNMSICLGPGKLQRDEQRLPSRFSGNRQTINRHGQPRRASTYRRWHRLPHSALVLRRRKRHRSHGSSERLAKGWRRRKRLQITETWDICWVKMDPWKSPCLAMVGMTPAFLYRAKVYFFNAVEAYTSVVVGGDRIRQRVWVCMFVEKRVRCTNDFFLLYNLYVV